MELFGAGFSEGKTALVIIAVGLLFNALSGSVGQVLNMTQHQEALKKYTIVSVVVNIVLNFILIKQNEKKQISEQFETDILRFEELTSAEKFSDP